MNLVTTRKNTQVKFLKISFFVELDMSLSKLREIVKDRCREPAQGVPPVAKVMRLRGLTGKGESGLKGASLDLLVHLPPKPESACLTALCFSPTLLTLYGGLSPPTSL